MLQSNNIILRNRRNFNFPIIFGCLFLLFAVCYFSTTNVQLAYSQEYIFERQFGSAGTSLGEFSQPQGIASDSSGNIYITSFTSLSNHIQKFTSNGTFITLWGSFGLGDGQFINPGGIDTDSSDNVYVADFGENNNIQKFDSNGNFITKWGSMGSGDGQFRHPASIAIDLEGNVFVADSDNDRIQVFKQVSKSSASNAVPVS